MVTVTAPATRTATSVNRIGAVTMLVSGLTALMVTIAAIVDPDLAQAGKSAYLVSGVVMCLVDLGVALGIAAVAAATPIALGRLRTPIVVLTVAASLAMVVAEAALRVDFATGTAAYGVVGPLQALGLIAMGVGIVRAGRWTSWRRFAVLAWGLYVPLVMVPLLAASGGTSLVALGGYHLGVVAAAWALRSELRHDS